jgi:outer membrane protein OmpA-like peptidoglycan-associated protein
MNKYSILRIVLAGLLVLTSTFCSSPDKKDTTEETPAPNTDQPSPAKDTKVTDADAQKEKMRGSENTVEPSVGYGELLDELSAKLREVRYPDGETIEGFEYKKWDIPNRKDFQTWLKGSAAVIQEVLEKLPATVKLEIVGHADATGPENREGDKLGNIYYSKKRAEEVKKFVVKVFKDDNSKIKDLEDRIITRGAGSSEPVPGIEGTSAKNRRVTFQLVDKGNGLKPSPGASESDTDIDSTK